MLIECPFCGSRSVQEFRYRGDATPVRPAVADMSANVQSTFADYVYLRDNPAGLLREHWFHAMGCRSWLVVARDTRTHAIASVEAVSTAGGQPS